jgi:hypothetical protein
MKKILHTLRRLAADFQLAMCRLNEIQFSAPWNSTRSRCG